LTKRCPKLKRIQKLSISVNIFPDFLFQEGARAANQLSYSTTTPNDIKGPVTIKLDNAVVSWRVQPLANYTICEQD
jgi:hypothetical protein